VIGGAARRRRACRRANRPAFARAIASVAIANSGSFDVKRFLDAVDRELAR
jgi:hypothetical protein